MPENDEGEWGKAAFVLHKYIINEEIRKIQVIIDADQKFFAREEEIWKICAEKPDRKLCEKYTIKTNI
jgi:hypothetical protein